MPLLIPAHKLRCLGHAYGEPGSCAMTGECARYQATATDPYDGTTRIVPRVCGPRWLDHFMPVPKGLRK
mgnify:CR=1 FL=1